MSGDLVLVKLGGSLITDKTRPATPRPHVLARLAEEIAALAAAGGPALLVGHGSGSFGHVAAERHGLDRPLASAAQLVGVAATQDQAARLHRLVVAALLAAGARPFSWAPSSAVVLRGGRPETIAVDSLAGALALGLLPVVYGDVVVDRERGAAICSTEQALLALVPPLAERGWRVRRAVWLGDTPGVWDAGGRIVTCLDRQRLASLAGAVGGSRGTDVTGGMEHRLETALELADLGVESWIGDGREPGALAAAVAGAAAGTVVRARCADADREPTSLG